MGCRTFTHRGIGGQCLLTLVVFVTAHANGIISDAVIIPPNYHSFNPPAQVGATYIDPSFGTKITRITNSGLTGPDVQGGSLGNSEISFFNIDGSYFIATENGDDGSGPFCFLYDGHTGARLKMLGTGTMRPWWIRWTIADHYTKNGQSHYFEPKYHFYKFEGNELRLYDVRTLEYVILHVFNEYNEIDCGGGEGDISDDGRYWVLDGDGKVLFVYDMIDDIKYAESNFNLGSLGSQGNQVGVDYACISPSGKYIVVAWGTPAAEERGHGIEVFDKNWNFQRQIYPGIIHWEVGTDAFGNDVVYTAAGSGVQEFYTSYGVVPGDFISIRLSDGYIRLLLHMPLWSGFVICANNTLTDPRYVYVAFHRFGLEPEQAWGPYWGEIDEIPTDGSAKVRRFVHHRARLVPGKSISYAQPDFIINRQGNKIIYRSTYTYTTGDLYMFDVSLREGQPTDTTPPNAPVGLHSPRQTFNSIELVWDRPPQAADGDYATSYEIWRDDAFKTTVNANKYTDTGLEAATKFTYKIFALDEANNRSKNAAFATVATLGDTIPPTLVYARALELAKVAVEFSEPLEQTSAEDVANYHISEGINILDTELQPDNITVLISTDRLTAGVEYTLSVVGVQDLSRNVVTNPLQITFHLLSDYYDNFESGVARGWRPIHPERWSVDANEGDFSYFLNTSDYESPGGLLLGEYTLLDQSHYVGTDFRISFWAKSAEDLSANNHADYAFVFAFQDTLNYCYVQFHSYDVILCKIVGGQDALFLHPTATIPLEYYSEIDIQLVEGIVIVDVNGEEILRQYIPDLEPGLLGLGSFNDSAYFDDLSFKALGVDVFNPAPQPPAGITVRP